MAFGEGIGGGLSVVLSVVGSRGVLRLPPVAQDDLS
jgi:hypothetical protein